MDYFKSVLMLALLWTLTSAKGEIHCYCNTPSCISTGYMCKSAVGRCFSRQHRQQGAASSDTVHGCIEKLTPKEQIACRNDGGIIVVKNQPRQNWPVVTCCKTDMCNYVNSLNINVNTDSSNKSAPKNLYHVKLNRKQSANFGRTTDDVTALRGRNSATQDGATSRDQSSERDYPINATVSQRDIWFRASVIAVPIAGGFILILLVLLAMRMLKNDRRREQSRAHHSLVKAQLYVAGHFFHDKNSKKNSSPHRTYHQPGASCTAKKYSNNMFSDVSLNVDGKKYPYEKLTAPRVLDIYSQQPSSKNSIVLVKLPDPHKDASIV